MKLRHFYWNLRFKIKWIQVYFKEKIYWRLKYPKGYRVNDGVIFKK